MTFRTSFSPLPRRNILYDWKSSSEEESLPLRELGSFVGAAARNSVSLNLLFGIDRSCFSSEGSVSYGEVNFLTSSDSTRSDVRIDLAII